MGATCFFFYPRDDPFLTKKLRTGVHILYMYVMYMTCKTSLYKRQMPWLLISKNYLLLNMEVELKITLNCLFSRNKLIVKKDEMGTLYS